MLAARRTAPIASDLESAFQAIQLPPPIDQLPTRCKAKPFSSPSSLLTPPPDEELFTLQDLPDSILGTDSAAATTDERDEERGRGRRNQYIPSHFPAFPLKHTYRETYVSPIRQKDPRKIREIATEEGRLGEEALRKLAITGGGEGELDLTSEVEEEGKQSAGRMPRLDQPQTIELMFERTMKELARAERAKGAASASNDAKNGGFEMAPIVNSERKYWMPDITRRAANAVSKPDIQQHSVNAESGQHRTFS